jgi:ankyrin repeat protein
MNLKCLLGGHTWNGCLCTRCKLIRENAHDWSRDSEKCAICGKKADSNIKADINALIEAVWSGNESAVKVLLEKGVSANVKRDMTVLMIAAEFGNKNIVRMLLDKGANVNAIAHGKTALMIGSESGKPGIVKLLLKYGAQIKVDGSEDFNALMIAVREGFPEIALLLLDSGADVEAKFVVRYCDTSDLDDSYYVGGHTALMLASGYGHLDLVNILLSKGADAKQCNDKGDSAISLAAEKGRDDIFYALADQCIDDAIVIAARHGMTEVVRTLINKGANINKRNSDGMTPLMLVAYNGHFEIVCLLLDEKADLNIAIPESGKTALILTSGYENRLNILNALLDAGADINIQCKNGDCALTEAAAYGSLEILQALISKGAKVNVKNSKGLTPLLLANHLDKVKILLDNGADINAVDSQGRNVLMRWAAARSQFMKELIAKTSNINSRDNSGRTALMLAANEGNNDLISDLISNGADINLKDNKGMTAYMYAAGLYKGAGNVMLTLLEKGQGVITETSDDGEAALYKEAYLRNWNTVLALLKRGAVSITSKNDGGYALIEAIKNGQNDVIKVLLDMGANINRDINGYSPLLLAVNSGNIDLIRILITKGADINAMGSYDNPLMRAIEKGHIDIVQLLIENGADVNIKNVNNHTPLNYARGHRDIAINAKLVEMLKTAGAKG